MEETELIQKLREKHADAYRLLFSRYKDKVFNTVLSMTQQYEEAEDVTQEVFVEVFQSIDGFKANARLSTWIYRIAVNKALESHRRRHRKKRFGNIVSLFSSGVGDAVENASDFRHPGLGLEEKERNAALFKAIDKLPENQKTAFVLHHLEGLPYKEISEVMQNSLGAVESLLFRGKQNVGKYLSGIYKHI